MNTKLLTALLLSLVIIVSFSSCDLLLNRPPKPSLTRLTEAEVASRNWNDDLDLESLQRATAQSVRYYESRPDTARFHYGNLVYSPREMAASLRLFLNTMENYRGGERTARLRKQFLFFESTNASGKAFFTGYYEPLLEGSREPNEAFPEPVYTVPDDLVEVDLSLFSSKWPNERIVGRVEGHRLVPYDSRNDIMFGDSLKDRAHPIAYVNEIELFFLQVQGSGLIHLQDGSMMRVNYAGKNGLPYTSIGGRLKDVIPVEQISLQSIKEYLYANPDKVKDILSLNESYVFFREADDGPYGSTGALLTPERSIAMDTMVIPEGTAAFILTELPVIENGRIIQWKRASRFVLVQDRGAAIVDHGRVDIFFGHGEKAELAAGHMKQWGRAFIIVARKDFL